MANKQTSRRRIKSRPVEESGANMQAGRQAWRRGEVSNQDEGKMEAEMAGVTGGSGRGGGEGWAGG